MYSVVLGQIDAMRCIWINLERMMRMDECRLSVERGFSS